jgi:hypothetical protein
MGYVGSIFLGATEPAYPENSPALQTKVTDMQRNAGETYRLMQKLDNDWHFVQRQNDSKKVKKFSSAASPSSRTVTTVSTASEAILNGTIVMESGHKILYYCRETSKVIARRNMDTSVEAALSMIVPGLQCSGRNMQYYEDAGNRYLLFTGYLNEMNQIYSLKLN